MNPNAMNSNGRSVSRVTMDLDNLLRRELKIGDPNDPSQIAQALSNRYQSDARARAIDGEARGLPFLNTPIVRSAEAPLQTASDIDLEQARSDVEMDLEELLSNNYTKDIRPELEGWQQVIQRSIDEGVSNAKFGLDSRKRDTTFAMRRQLGEYGRLSRLLGALTPALNTSFRSLATSLDEVCAVLLVLMGESMANVGFSGGRFLLQVSYSDLQARRDAVLQALRRVEGVSTNLSSNDSWPRGLRAYRALGQALEYSGQGDLRSLMNEAELTRTMDHLVQLASGGSPRGLRAVGATAWGPVNRLYRFVQSTVRPVSQSSSELATFYEALLLFLDGFGSAGGFRLLRVARPTVLNYGLYGSSNVTPAERRLMELVNRRGMLGRELDNLTQLSVNRNFILTQIALDKILYDVDRAIDYYCVGDVDLGVPEVRAASFSHVIDAVLPVDRNNFPPPALFQGGAAPDLWPWAPSAIAGGGNPIPYPAFLAATMSPQARVAGELNAIRSLLRPRPGGAVPGAMANPYPEGDWWEVGSTEVAYRQYLLEQAIWPAGGSGGLRFGAVLQGELSAQRQADIEWRAVIEQMAGNAVLVAEILDAPEPPTQVSGCLPILADRAMDYLASATANSVQPLPFDSTPADPPIPPHFEQALELIAINT